MFGLVQSVCHKTFLSWNYLIENPVSIKMLYKGLKLSWSAATKNHPFLSSSINYYSLNTRRISERGSTNFMVLC